MYRSFRNTENGSWYVNALVQVFMEDACKLDVCALLNKVFVNTIHIDVCVSFFSNEFDTICWASVL